MNDDIMELVKYAFNFDETVEFHFREIYGFTFVIKKSFLKLNKKVTSAEVKVAGIIFEENGEYYFAPLDKHSKKEQIIKEFVEVCLK